MKLAAVFIACAVLLGACASVSVETRPQAPISSEAITARFRNRLDYWRSYQASLRVRVESSKGRYSLRAVVVAELPDRIRLEAFNPFGQTMGVLLQDRGKSTLWIPSENVVYTATKTENLTGHFLGVPIPPELFGYSLVACIPPAYLERLDVYADASGTKAVAAQQQKDWSLSWTLQPGPLALESLNVRQGNRKYAVNYEPAADLVLVEAPRKISFTAADWQMEVTVNQIRNAPELSNSVFSITYPDGLKKVDLDKGK
ncbi:MAG: hypothetical protein ABFD98_13085 [Syntrophobacteraceae bacterium]|nr:hypothetical protein [Desulfobacteraceae bacterium]